MENNNLIHSRNIFTSFIIEKYTLHIYTCNQMILKKTREMAIEMQFHKIIQDSIHTEKQDKEQLKLWGR